MFLWEVEFFFSSRESLRDNGNCSSADLSLGCERYIYLSTAVRVLVRFTLRVIFEKPFKIAGAFRRVEFERIFKYVS